jgi:hypothetical protein
MLFLVHRFLSLWWWRRYVPPKRRFLQEPHGVTSQKTAFFTLRLAPKTVVLFKCKRYSFRDNKTEAGDRARITSMTHAYFAPGSSSIRFVFIHFRHWCTVCYRLYIKLRKAKHKYPFHTQLTLVLSGPISLSSTQTDKMWRISCCSVMCIKSKKRAVKIREIKHAASRKLFK